MPDIYGSGIATALDDDLFDVPFELSGEQFNFFISSLTLAPVDLLLTSTSRNGDSNESLCCSEQTAIQTIWGSPPQAPSAIELSRLKSIFSDTTQRYALLHFVANIFIYIPFRPIGSSILVRRNEF